MDKVPSLSAVPFALLSEGEDHQCLLPLEETNTPKSPFQLEASYEVAKAVGCDIWVINESCFHLKGTSPYRLRCTPGSNRLGFARHCVAPFCPAEIVAIAAALDAVDRDSDNDLLGF